MAIMIPEQATEQDTDWIDEIFQPTAPAIPTPNDKIREAADLIEKKGWIQGSMFKDDGYCALGAIYTVCNGGDEPLYYKAAGLLAGCLSNKSITCWNDQFGQTKEIVIQTMRYCAEAQ